MIIKSYSLHVPSLLLCLAICQVVKDFRGRHLICYLSFSLRRMAMIYNILLIYCIKTILLIIISSSSNVNSFDSHWRCSSCFNETIASVGVEQWLGQLLKILKHLDVWRFQIGYCIFFENAGVFFTTLKHHLIVNT